MPTMRKNPDGTWTDTDTGKTGTAYESNMWTQGPDWDWHDAYDWFPGIKSGEDIGREQALARSRQGIPQPPEAWSPEAAEAFAYMRAMTRPEASPQNRMLGGRMTSATVEQSDLYKGLLRRIERQMEQEGRQAGGRLAQQGVLATGAYGPGSTMADSASKMKADMAAEAYIGAWNALAAENERTFDRAQRADAQRWNQLFQQAGFAQGVQSEDFERKFRAWAAENGLTMAEINLELQRIRDQWGFWTGGVMTGLAAYDWYTGGPEGREESGLRGESK